MSSEPPVVLFGCVVFILRVYFCVFVDLWQNYEIGCVVILQMFCLVPGSENVAPHQSAVLPCARLCGCRATLCSLISFWWRIFHEACRHESQVFHKNIALEHAEPVLSGQTEGILPHVDLCCTCRFHVFWMSGQITISVLVSSLLPQVSKPEHVGTLGREPDPLESHWGWSRWRKSHSVSHFCALSGRRLWESTSVWRKRRTCCCPPCQPCRTKHNIWSATWVPRLASSWTCSPCWETLADSWKSLKVLLSLFFCSVPSHFSQVQNSCAVWLILKVLTAEIVLQFFYFAIEIYQQIFLKYNL